MKLVERAPWMKKAACRGVDPDVMFPDRDDARGIEAARKVCGVCDVRVVCQMWALDHREMDGVWGGLSSDERRVVLRERSRSGRMKRQVG